MDYQEQIPRRPVSRKDMLKRVARFSKLKGSDGGLPDSHHPGAERILYNVIGFQPPSTEEGGMVSPVGDKAARMSAIKISEGFNLGFCRAPPHRGPPRDPAPRKLRRRRRAGVRDRNVSGAFEAAMPAFARALSRARTARYAA